MPDEQLSRLRGSPGIATVAMDEDQRRGTLDEQRNLAGAFRRLRYLRLCEHFRKPRLNLSLVKARDGMRGMAW